MKLSNILESFIGEKIRETLKSTDYFDRPLYQSDPAPVQMGSLDGNNSLVTGSTGIPAKQRHRQYLGMEKRPGVIRL